MSDPFQDIAERKRRDRAEAKRQSAQERDDMRALLALPAMQRMLLQFFTAAGLDSTTYRDKPQAMAFATGWQDAARWWQHLIRTHCPEREAQMRALANRLAREGVSENEDGPEPNDE